jgi:hypothetical protein
MSRTIERSDEQVLELRQVYLHKIGTRDCLRNYITRTNPTGEDAKADAIRRKKIGLKPLEDEASIALDSTTDGRVTPKNIHGINVSGSYQVVEIDYGEAGVLDTSRSVGLTFREYVSLGRPKAVKLSTRWRVTPVLGERK